MKVKNVGFHLIRQISMPFLLINMKLLILIIVYLLKELQKEYGNCVHILIKMENRCLKLQNGNKNLNKQTELLETTVREF